MNNGEFYKKGAKLVCIDNSIISDIKIDKFQVFEVVKSTFIIKGINETILCKIDGKLVALRANRFRKLTKIEEAMLC